MSFNWTSESLVAAAAMVIAMIGGAGTVAVKWGSVNTTVAEVQAHDTDQDKKIDATDKALDAQKLLDAAIAQKLDDFGHQLDRIEKKL